jgi:hypothetical protein
MDTDSSPQNMGEGACRYNLDIRIAYRENGNKDGAETPKGNTLVAYTLPAGNNIVIGSDEYKKNKKV